jgi:hypothetical protein
MRMENYGGIILAETEKLGENPVLVSLYPPQIPQGLPWAHTPASAVRDW